MSTAKYGRVDVVQLLFEKSADINAGGWASSPKAPLIYAAENGYANVES